MIRLASSDTTTTAATNDSAISSTGQTKPDAALASLDDMEFLSLCRTVRRVAERVPEDELSAEARAKLEAVNAEFLRRAGITWQRTA
jgi:hypothetical protein